jgi:hypothetical protein
MISLDPVVGIPVRTMPRRRQQFFQHHQIGRRQVGRNLARAVDVAPSAGDLHVRLIHLPAISDPMAAGPGGLSEQRREPLHPPVDGDVVDSDAALGEQLLHVAVGEAEARYQRTASTITSGGKQKPAKADRGMGSGRTRRVLMTPVWLVGSGHSRCNSASPLGPGGPVVWRLPEGRAARSARWVDPMGTRRPHDVNRITARTGWIQAMAASQLMCCYHPTVAAPVWRSTCSRAAQRSAADRRARPLRRFLGGQKATLP